MTPDARRVERSDENESAAVIVFDCGGEYRTDEYDGPLDRCPLCDVPPRHTVDRSARYFR